MKRGTIGGRLLVWIGFGLAALAGVAPTAQTPQGRVGPLPDPINTSADPLLRPFIWRSIGPANMGGRVDDIAVVESNPSIIYVGYATGGIWKTTNNGTTWTPIFDTYPVSSIGDIAIAPSNPDVIYVGTGEPNNRQSSSFGGGVYKSVDAGKTFTYIGLKETQSIGRIVVHPKDPNTAYVAAVGHLFGPNAERGLYKTTDGGATWTNTKFIDNDTGFTDVVMDPANPNVLLAASYQRRRAPWGFNGGGAGSGIWKTTDGGKNWTRLTGKGLPEHPVIGRIGLDVSRSKRGVIYASIEVGPSGGTGAGVNEDGTLAPAGQRGSGSGGARANPNVPPAPPDPKKSGVWRSDDGGKTWRCVSNQGDRWMYYSQIRIDPTNTEIAYQGGAPFFKTIDGGRTWRQVQGIAHSDHHAIWINPTNSNHLIIGNDGGIDVSYDQGETWEYVNTVPVGQFYAISADMRRPYYVCGGLQDNGSWCGPSATRNSNGILNSDWYRIGGGDGFYTQNDQTDWTVLYSESQDGNMSRVELKTGRTTGIRPRGPQAPGTATASGPAERQDPEGPQAPQPSGARGNPAGNVVPPPPQGTTFRFYWNTPFILSPHNQSTIYLGGDRLFRSYDRGATWTASADLTRNIGRNDRPIMGVAGPAPMPSKHDGAASYSNIVSISESPYVPGILWVGTNDGNLQVSRDGGATWRNAIDNVPGVPKETQISRVETSHFDGATCYVTFDNHRVDDHKPYVFVTNDYGETWTSISNNLPEGNVNVIREDPKNRDLLYLGTEYAFYVSLNGGREWKRFMNGLPTVRIDDILVHRRDNDLIVATHGRSIYIIDDVTPLQQLTDSVMKTDSAVFDVRPAVVWLTDIQKSITVGGAKVFRGENPARGTSIAYWLNADADADVRVSIADVTGRELRSIPASKSAGLHRVQWDLTTGFGGGRRGQGGQGAQAAAAPTTQRGATEQAQTGGGRGSTPPPVAPGSYLAKVMVGDKTIGAKVIVVEADTLVQ